MGIVVFVDNVEVPLAPGKYQYRADVGSGDVTIEIGDGAGGFQTMTNGTITADEDGTLVVGDYPIRVQLTGTAAFSVSPLPSGS